MVSPLVAPKGQSVRHCVRSNTQRELSVANHCMQFTAVALLNEKMENILEFDEGLSGSMAQFLFT